MRVLKWTVFIVFMFGIISLSQAQTPDDNLISKDEVLQLMQTYQDGYIKRDTALIDDFMELFTDDMVCMGVASHEFFKGKKSLRKLTLWDWKKWFDLRIPLDKIDIRIEDNTAWFAVIGTSGPWRDTKTYEIRLVGSLVKTDGKLQFKQICYSYPAPLKVVE